MDNIDIDIVSGLLVKCGDVEEVVANDAQTDIATKLAAGNYVIVDSTTAYADTTGKAAVTQEKLALPTSWQAKKDSDGVVTLAPAVKVNVPATTSGEAFEGVTATYNYTGFEEAQDVTLGDGGSDEAKALFFAQGATVTFKATSDKDTALTVADAIAATITVGSAKPAAVTVNGGEGTWNITLTDAGDYAVTMVKAVSSVDLTDTDHALVITAGDVGLEAVDTNVFKAWKATFTAEGYLEENTPDQYVAGTSVEGTIEITAKDGKFFADTMKRGDVTAPSGVTVLGVTVSADKSTVTITVAFEVAPAAAGSNP